MFWLNLIFILLKYGPLVWKLIREILGKVKDKPAIEQAAVMSQVKEVLARMDQKQVSLGGKFDKQKHIDELRNIRDAIV